MGEDREDLILKAIDDLKNDVVKGFDKIDNRLKPLEEFKTKYETIRTAILALVIMAAALMAFLWNYNQYTNFRPAVHAEQSK